MDILSLITAASEAAETVAEQPTFSLVNIDPNTIIFTLINTGIIVLIYFFFLHKPVCKILDQRAEAVNKDMDDAQKAREEAEAVKAEYEQRLEQSKEEAGRILSDATKRAQQRGDEIVAEANAEAATIKQRAEESIEREKKRAVNEIKEEIADMVIAAASKVAEKEISAADNERIISAELERIGKES